MPNLLLTGKCVRNCPYCFAEKHMDQASPRDILSWENLIYVSDFLLGSGKNNISLLGGEPLLHPDLPAMARYMVRRGFHVNIFTSGICAPSMREKLRELADALTPDALNLVVNYNHPSLSGNSEQEAIEAFFSELRNVISLSCNVYKTGFDYSYLADAICKYGLRHTVRIGLSHPLPTRNNACIAPDRLEMAKMAQELTDALPMFDSNGITISMDCGFPLCSFTDEQLGKLYRHNAAGMRFRCASAVDITPDLRIANCFPLAEIQSFSLLDFDDYNSLKDGLTELTENLFNLYGGIYPECNECIFRLKDLCSGGCLGHAINRNLKTAAP